EGNVSVSLVEGLNETISTTKFYQYLIGFRSSPSVLNKRNFNSILATQLSIFVDGKGLKTVSLIRNPNQSISTFWLKSDNISGFDFNADRSDLVQGGEILANFQLAGGKSLVLNLEDIFRLNRFFLTTKYTKNIQLSNDIEPQIYLGSDEIWVIVKDSSRDLDYVTWEVSETTNCQPTYPDDEYIQFQSTGYSKQSIVNVSVNIIEV
ncbi:MAG: hypothetical protein ACKPE3_03290, partial [Sphaerospermopsis kisseleviana]